MISDKSLLKMAAAVFVIGLAMLFVISAQQPRFVAISDLDESMVGERVSVRGTIDSITGGDMTFIVLADGTARISVVAFDPPEIKLARGDGVIASGEIGIYRGNLEIIANKISRA